MFAQSMRILLFHLLSHKTLVSDQESVSHCVRKVFQQFGIIMHFYPLLTLPFSLNRALMCLVFNDLGHGPIFNLMEFGPFSFINIYKI